MKKLLTAAGSLLITAYTLTPVAFAADLQITDNGAKSDNTIIVKSSDTTLVSQLNKSVVLTEVASYAGSGGNTIKGQTGGDAGIGTGAAVSSVGVAVSGPVNASDTGDDCGCPQPNSVEITGNGYRSDNTVKIMSSEFTGIHQANIMSVGTGITSGANTGKNKILWGTGGSAGILTGFGKSVVSVQVQAPSNILN